MTIGQGSHALSITACHKNIPKLLLSIFSILPNIEFPVNEKNKKQELSAPKCAFLYSVNFRIALNLQFNRASQLTAVLMEIKLMFCCLLVLFAFGSSQEVAHSFTAQTHTHAQGSDGKIPRGVTDALSPPSHTATVASVSLTSMPSAHHVYVSVCVFLVMSLQSCTYSLTRRRIYKDKSQINAQCFGCKCNDKILNRPKILPFVIETKTLYIYLTFLCIYLPMSIFN